MADGYYVYRGVGGLANVDFDTPVATLGAAETTPTLSALGHAASTRYTYVVRPFRGALVTPDYSCVCEFETDADGEWAGQRPGPVRSVDAEIGSGGQITVRWNHLVPYGEINPKDFAVYYRTAGGAYGSSPNTTKTFAAGRRDYQHTFTLSDATAYYFKVAARTAAGVESHADEIGPFVADATAPSAPAASVTVGW